MTDTQTAGTPVIRDHYEKLDLPVGVVMEVAAGRWEGQRWIKTGDITWAQIRSGDHVMPDAELQEMVERRQNNISPCPSEALAFPPEYTDRNLAVLARATLRGERELKRIRHRQGVLEQRNETARRALSGIKED